MVDFVVGETLGDLLAEIDRLLHVNQVTELEDMQRRVRAHYAGPGRRRSRLGKGKRQIRKVSAATFTLPRPRCTWQMARRCAGSRTARLGRASYRANNRWVVSVQRELAALAWTTRNAGSSGRSVRCASW